MKTKKENVNDVNVEIKSDVSVESDLDTTPVVLPSLEDVVINLGFWLDMLHRLAPKILQSKLNGMPESVKDKKSEV